MLRKREQRLLSVARKQRTTVKCMACVLLGISSPSMDLTRALLILMLTVSGRMFARRKADVLPTMAVALLSLMLIVNSQAAVKARRFVLPRTVDVSGSSPTPIARRRSVKQEAIVSPAKTS